MNVSIRKLSHRAIIPTQGSEQAAGYDLYADLYPYDEATVSPHETMKVHTGLSMEIPEGYFGAIFARSGLATKRSLRPANCVGVVDSDYRGEIIVAIHNDSDDPMTFKDLERIAQIVFIPHGSAKFELVESLSETERSDGGFGSTGKYAENATKCEKNEPVTTP